MWAVLRSMNVQAGYKTAAGSLKMFLVERQEGHSGSGQSVARYRESAATLSISRVIDTNTTATLHSH